MYKGIERFDFAVLSTALGTGGYRHRYLCLQPGPPPKKINHLGPTFALNLQKEAGKALCIVVF